MKFSFWPNPSQSFKTMRTLALHVEQTNWDGFWLADHFMPNDEDVSQPWPEAWTTLSALAALVPRIRFGTLVSGNTYRHPAILAKMAATADHISGGRIVLGLGSGWQENEHQKYGIEFDTVAGRLKRLEEACQVITGLFSQERFNFDGEYYQLKDAPLEPKPLQSPLPLLIGGGGEKVTLRITAQYANEWNVWGGVEVLKHKMAILDQHCADLGRDPKDIKRSAVVLLFLSDDQAFVDKMLAAQDGPARIAGNIDQLRETVAAYKEIGVDELIIPDFTLGPDCNAKKIETLNTFIEEIAPAGR